MESNQFRRKILNGRQRWQPNQAIEQMPKLGARFSNSENLSTFDPKSKSRLLTFGAAHCRVVRHIEYESILQANRRDHARLFIR